MTSCSYDFSKYREALSKKGLLLLLILSLAIVAMVFFHIKGMNGPWYFKWSWQRLNSPWTFVFTLIAAVPFFVGHYLHFRSPQRIYLALLLVSLSTFLLEVTCAARYSPHFGFNRVSGIVESPVATSYYTIAAGFFEGAQARPLLEWLQIRRR